MPEKIIFRILNKSNLVLSGRGTCSCTNSSPLLSYSICAQGNTKSTAAEFCSIPCAVLSTGVGMSLCELSPVEPQLQVEFQAHHLWSGFPMEVCKSWVTACHAQVLLPPLKHLMKCEQMKQTLRIDWLCCASGREGKVAYCWGKSELLFREDPRY